MCERDYDQFTRNYHNNSWYPLLVSRYSHNYLWKLLRYQSYLPFKYLTFLLYSIIFLFVEHLKMFEWFVQLYTTQFNLSSTPYCGAVDI